MYLNDYLNDCLSNYLNDCGQRMNENSPFPPPSSAALLIIIVSRRKTKLKYKFQDKASKLHIYILTYWKMPIYW